MLHLVTGGSGSGKSEYGENWLTQKNDGQTRTSLREAPFLYIATMEPFGEEAKKRIRRHRKMRAFKGFHTVECYRNLSQLNISCIEKKIYAGVLLECMSNLVANELYLPDSSMRKEEEVVESVIMGVENLKRQTDAFVIVTNEVTSDGIQYSPETRIYQQLLGRINQALAGQADLVTEVVYGIPVRIKGRIDE